MQLSATALSFVIDSAIETAIIALDVEGRVLSWNLGAARILGWSEQEMLGQSLHRIFPPDADPDGQLAREMSDALSKGRGGHEGWRVRADGKKLWAVGEMAPVRDAAAAPVAFVKVLRDRTQWKLTDDALKEQTRILEILNRVGNRLARENDLPQLVQAVTDAGVEATGARFGAFFYNIEDSSGKSYMLFTLSGVSREAFSTFPMPRNTAIFSPTFEGKGIVRSDDITKDPRYGRSSPYWGMPEGHVKVVSYLAVPVFSRTGAVIGGLFFGHPEPGRFDDRSEGSMVVLAAEAGIAIDNARLFQAAQRELDERKKAEAALQTLNATLESQVAERTAQLRQHEEALRQAQKMEAVGQLTGGIAHDFNNLLQGIIGNLAVLRKFIGKSEDQGLDVYVSRAMTSANKAAALTHRLLAFSRRQPLNPQLVQVNPLVASMEDMLRRSLGENIELLTRFEDGLWAARCDENQLENAILNLVINARDAMPDGGCVTIETRNIRFDAGNQGPQPHDIRPGEYVRVSVADSGVGMSEETLAHAFEPFFTTKPIGQGTGLGLAMIYGFARQSHGYARIQSELGKGTTVALCLPAHRGVDKVSQPLEATPAPQPASVGKVVLVVEDEPIVRALIVDVLSGSGYTVLEASDGQTALEQLQSDKPLDLLLTDIGLPGINGRQLAETALANRPGLPVIFMTGYAEKVALPPGFSTTGHTILTKPFPMETLLERVHRLLAPDKAGD